MKISDRKFGFFLSIPGVLVLLLLIIVPLIFLFLTSFLRYDNIRPVTFYGVKNYQFLFKHRVFWLSFKNTLIFCGGVTSLTFCISLLMAHSLTRIARGSSILRSLAMFPWAVPMIVSGFMWAQMFNPSFGVINDFLLRMGFVKEPIDIFGNPDMAMMGVIIADSWARIPFMTIIILAGLESIPPTLYEVAKTDGADILQTFIHISLPLNKKAMLTGLLITSIFSFRTIDVIFSLTFGGPAKATYVFGFYILDFIYRFFDFGVAASLSVVMLFLLLSIGSIFIYNILKGTKL